MLSANDIFTNLKNNPKYKTICKTDIYNFPKPFYKNISAVKAIVLGADPSNSQGKTFDYVFGLEESENSQYFKPILSNLTYFKLNLSNIYVQNLCPNYFTFETSKNKFYCEIATKYWLPKLREELDKLFSSSIPVFATAWKVIEVTAPASKNYKRNKLQIYKNAVIFKDTMLNRPVISLFRGGHGYYNLEKPEYKKYISSIIRFLKILNS